jgi:peptidyl-prolyl cis-trans isomerase C
MPFPKSVLILSFAAVLAGQTPAPKAIAPVKPASPEEAKPAPTLPPDKVVLTIGDQKFTVADYDKLLDSLPEQYRLSARGPGKRQFVEQFVRVRVLANEARRRGLDRTPAFQKQLEMQTENLLAGALYQDLSMNTKIDEAAAHKYYEDHKNEYEQVKARHILVRTKGAATPLRPNQKELTDEEALAKAQELRKRLVGGEDFATLAKAESDDVGSGAAGGDLGFFKRGRMVPAFDKAAFSLPIGQLSEPVKSPFGYHLIQVEKKEFKTFEEVRPEMERRMRPEMARQAVEDLRKQASVTIDDGFFGAATPPRPPRPPVGARPGAGAKPPTGTPATPAPPAPKPVK